MLSVTMFRREVYCEYENLENVTTYRRRLPVEVGTEKYAEALTHRGRVSYQQLSRNNFASKQHPLKSIKSLLEFCIFDAFN